MCGVSVVFTTRDRNAVSNNMFITDSGDKRVNQNPNMAVQTISLLRLHNYLCDQLGALNPHWEDERLYQEARRLLIAMYQHVTYNEYVPLLVGKYNMIIGANFNHTDIQVKIGIVTSQPTRVMTGLRQEDALSPVLFNLVLERVIRELNILEGDFRSYNNWTVNICG